MTTITEKPKTRWQEINEIWKKDKWLYGIIGGLAGFMVGIAASDYLGQFVSWFWNGFWNEALSIAITVIVLDRLNKLRTEQERKEELIFQLGSEETVVAKQAARLLRHKGWLTDGSLKESDLEAANLEGSDLVIVNLEGANLRVANLKGANLMLANLKGANLGKTDLQGAYLIGTNFEDASLFHANLYKANLKSANIKNVAWKFELGNQVFMATLPDGTKWTEGRDMREFTHPEKWRKEQVNAD